MDILNNPALFIGIVVGSLVVIGLLIWFIVKFPSMKANAIAKKQAKEEKKRQEQENFEHQSAVDMNIFEKRDQVIGDGKNEEKADIVVGTLQHRRDEVVYKQEKKHKEDAHKAAQANDVLSIMGGQVSSASAYKTVDSFGEKVKAEAQAKENAKEEEIKKASTAGVFEILSNAKKDD